MRDFARFIGHERVDETAKQIEVVLSLEPDRCWRLSELAKNLSEPNLNAIRVAPWQLIDEGKVELTSDRRISLHYNSV